MWEKIRTFLQSRCKIQCLHFSRDFIKGHDVILSVGYPNLWLHILITLEKVALSVDKTSDPTFRLVVQNIVRKYCLNLLTSQAEGLCTHENLAAKPVTLFSVQRYGALHSFM
jgi:hypothetical protein